MAADRPRLALAVGLLALGGVASLPYQLDDVYIVWAEAWRMLQGIPRGAAEQGSWPCTSPLGFCLLLAGALAHLPPGLVTKGTSFLAGIGVLALLDRAAPSRGAPGGAFGTLWLWMIAASFPLGAWSALGMETTLAALALGTGWRHFCAGDRRSGPWLLLGSLVRPEGLGWLAIGSVATPALRPWLAASVVSLAGWSMLLGLPSSLLVKLGGGGSVGVGAVEVAAGVVIFAPWVAGALATGGTRGRGRWAWAPLLLHVVEVVRVGGDWMGRGRLLLPAFVALAASAPLGGGAVTGVGWAVLLLTLPTVFVEAHLPTLDGGALRARSWAPARGLFDLETPLRGDVEWLVRRPRDGTSVATRDVGMPLLASWVQVRDEVGLVDTDVALAVSGLGGQPSPPADCRRATTPAPGTLPPVANGVSRDVLWNDEQFSSWECAEGAVDWAGPGTRLARWGDLFAAVPDQPWVRWNYTRALAETGRYEEARRIATAPLLPNFLNADVADALFFVDGPLPTTFDAEGRGWGLLWQASLRSRPLGPREQGGVRLLLSADAPGEEGAVARIAWDCEDGPVQVVAVHDPLTVDVPPPGCGGGARQLVVGFVNDGTTPEGDRNLWVRRVPRPPADAERP